MNPDRAALVVQAVLVSLERWGEEASQLQVAPGHEVAKHHLMASLRQAELSLKQMVARDLARQAALTETQQHGSSL